MSSKAVAQLHETVSAVELHLIAQAIQQYELDANESLISGSDIDLNRGRVLAAREIRDLLKLPKGTGGQA